MNGISRENIPYSDISYLSKSSRRSQRVSATIVDDGDKENQREYNSETSKLNWPKKCCPNYYHDVNTLNEHIQGSYKTTQLSYCSECEKKFSTRVHLRLHSCDQLQDHLDQHMIYSIPCAYCDRFFLQEDSLSRHQRTEHSRKVKEKMVYRKKLILKKVIYEKNTVLSEQSSSVGKYIFQVLVHQDFVPVQKGHNF